MVGEGTTRPGARIGGRSFSRGCRSSRTMRLLQLPSSGFRSPLITGLGLSLLLRTDAVWVPPLAATIAIGAKYLIRVRGKHVFNPGMLGLTTCILFSGHAWCSPSQWGEGMAMLAWFAVLGLAVV